MDLKTLIKSKTFYTGIAGIITGIGLIVYGNKSEGIQTIVGALGLIFIRDAIAKKDK